MLSGVEQLSRAQFECALRAVELGQPVGGAAEAAARWRSAQRDLDTGRLPWREFLRLASQVKPPPMTREWR